MLKLSHAIAFSVLSAGLVNAAIVPCISDTAADYVANFSAINSTTGCTITVGSTTLLFNGFGFIHAASGPTAGGAANQINLSPLSDINGLGFDITPLVAYTASATGVNDFELMFSASVVGGASLINDLFLSMTGSAGAAGVGGGSPGTDVLLEQYCRGGSVPPGSCPAGQGGPQTSTVTITGPATGVTATAHPTFAPTNALSVLKDVQLNGNNGNIASTITDVKNQVSIPGIPEPGTAWLAAVGCALVAFSVRRRSKQTN